MFLSCFGIKTYAMDLEKEMVESARKRFKKYRCKCKVIQGDINNIPFKDKFFSVTHSSGVLEHYSDSEIVNMINEQLRVSDYCVFSVPTSYFEKRCWVMKGFFQENSGEKLLVKVMVK